MYEYIVQDEGRYPVIYGKSKALSTVHMYEYIVQDEGRYPVIYGKSKALSTVCSVQNIA